MQEIKENRQEQVFRRAYVARQTVSPFFGYADKHCCGFPISIIYANLFLIDYFVCVHANPDKQWVVCDTAHRSCYCGRLSLPRDTQRGRIMAGRHLYQVSAQYATQSFLLPAKADSLFYYLFKQKCTLCWDKQIFCNQYTAYIATSKRYTKLGPFTMILCN